MHGRLQQKGRHYFRKKEKETSWAAQGKSLGEEMLQRVRRKPATLIHWTHTETEKELNENRSYLVTVTTELGETETLSVSACNEEKAEELAIDWWNEEWSVFGECSAEASQ